MEFLSGSVLPWLSSLAGWFSEGLRTEVAAAWAQAILGALAILASYKLAQQHFDRANEIELMRRAEGDRQNVVRFKALIFSAFGTLCSVRDAAVKYPDACEHVLAHAYDELMRCSDTLHRLGMEDLPDSRMIDAVFTFSDVVKGCAKWLEIYKDKVLGDEFRKRIEDRAFTLDTMSALLEKYIDEHRKDSGAKFQVDYQSLIKRG